MPNWCYNETVFYGDKETVQKLYKGLEETIDYRTNDHIDNFYKLLGVKEEQLNDEYRSRAHIVNFDINKEGDALILSYESAWGPIIETIDNILKEYQPNLKEVTYAEECGEGIYINTDEEGLYFTDKYYLDMSTKGGDDFNDIKHHATLESAINEFKRFYNVDVEINTKEELEEQIEKIEELYDYDVYITFDEFTPYYG